MGLNQIIESEISVGSVLQLNNAIFFWKRQVLSRFIKISPSLQGYKQQTRKHHYICLLTTAILLTFNTTAAKKGSIEPDRSSIYSARRDRLRLGPLSNTVCTPDRTSPRAAHHCMQPKTYREESILSSTTLRTVAYSLPHSKVLPSRTALWQRVIFTDVPKRSLFTGLPWK